MPVDGREPMLPGPLEGALHSLYGNYEKAFDRWQDRADGVDGSTPPVFIVVCNNTNVSKLVFDYIAGWEKQLPSRGTVVVPGRLDHRVLDAERPPPSVTEAAGAGASDSPTFEQTIFDNLRKAGVHNTFKSEAITFDRLDVYAGTWIQAEGEFTDADGETRRVAVSLGPEHGTVGPDAVKEAAKEAMRGAGFDLLVVCGFA